MPNDLKNIFKYFLITLLLSSCNSKEENVEEATSLHSVAKKVKLNINEGYTLNQVTGDSIEPVVNSLGETVISGKVIPVQGKVIHQSSVSNPKIVAVGEPKLDSANNNVFKIRHTPTVVVIDKENLKIKEVPTGNDKERFVLNSVGDTIFTGVPIPIKGKIIPCVHPKPIAAKPPKFKDNTINNMRYFDVDQGMASSYVDCIFQDSRGRMWFGTEGGGVSKYDGTGFVHYTEKEGLSNNNVTSIIEDSKGNLWFGTDGGGATKYDGSNFVHYTEKEGLITNRVVSVLEDSKGQIWIGTEGGGISKIYKKESEEYIIHLTQNEGLSNNNTRSMLEDSKGNMWICTYWGGVSKYDGSNFVRFTERDGLSSSYAMDAVEDKEGNIWFATNGGGVNKYDGKTFTHYTEKEGLNHTGIWSIAIDVSGDIWLGSYGGGVSKLVMDETGNKVTHTVNYSVNEGMSNDYIMEVLPDLNGSVWVGTYGGGVVKIDENRFRHYTEENGLSNNYVWSIIETMDENYWVGMEIGGATKLMETSVNAVHYLSNYNEKEGLSNKTVFTSLEDRKGNMWFGTYGGGVSKLVLDTTDGEGYNQCVQYGRNEGLSGSLITAIIEDNVGNIWFGSMFNGVSKYEPSTGNFIHYKEEEGLPSNQVMSLLYDEKGNIWIATFGGGVTKYDGANFFHYTEKEGLSNNNVLSILQDVDGNMWFGTDGGGVSKLVNNDSEQSFTYYTEKEGVSDNVINSLVEDNNNNIWLGTTKGLCLLKQERDEFQIHTFGKDDGLKSEYFVRNSTLSDSRNQLWWGTGKGIAVLDVDNFHIPNNSLSVQLTHLEINEQHIDYNNFQETNNAGFSFKHTRMFENYPNHLKLDYDHNHLAFYFSAIDWTSPHKIKYSYKIEKLNTNWSVPTYEAKADYRNIPYGKYTFKVRARGESQVWSEPFEYNFTILPPWWHTWWARTIYMIVFLGLGVLIMRWRTKKLKQRQNELERKVTVATKEIRDQKEKIEEAHKEITDSIAYAKRIQSAILPPASVIKEHLEESFVLYKPKDVVAGDFYWLEHKKGKTLFAVADCTGHGVPGAMVSVVCNNGLNRSVREHGLTDPGKILDRTREIIINEFDKSEDDVNDGMDIALCSLDGKELLYAGAHNPLWVIRNKEILETKADKQPIGKFDNPSLYTTHSIKLQKGDAIYIFSDGFVDQFGGDKGKKFKAIAFRELLLSIQDKEMKEQCLYIDGVFEEWKGSLEQIDDVCIIGVRV